ncbi:CHC2 zinc finger domain-containing protein [uncultured Ruminococcus sp.]|uniref:CHC2 zinc finger domain-containing protein n=1 Tax=uncultured Ruminococcus sp. TaxID=165186 RepID=UPI002589D1F6|nr:CHC2 zinc finger domain-containing protein [uncultured Ruminococcus sp.]
MTVFEQVKSAIDMKTVAEGYGLHIDRGGMTLCPFHNERTPSAKIYPDALHCFGCGTHVDVIGFTQKMFGLDKPIDAVKKLNYDYDLHIEISKTPTAEEVSEYQKHIREKREYEEWEKQAWRTLNDYLWLMREWKEYAPLSPDEKIDERFVYSLHHLDYAEYLCLEFINYNKAGRLSMKNIVSEIADFLKNMRADFSKL